MFLASDMIVLITVFEGFSWLVWRTVWADELVILPTLCLRQALQAACITVSASTLSASSLVKVSVSNHEEWCGVEPAYLLKVLSTTGHSPVSCSICKNCACWLAEALGMGLLTLPITLLPPKSIERISDGSTFFVETEFHWQAILVLTVVVMPRRTEASNLYRTAPTWEQLSPSLGKKKKDSVNSTKM